MTTKTRSRLIVLCIFAFPFVVLFGFLVSQLAGPLPPVQPLPNPNGYDDFVKAGKMVEQNITDKNYDVEKLNLQELQTLVDENSNALQLVRAGLQMQSLVKLNYSAVSPANFGELSDLKQLAQAFTAEGKLAEMENRPDDAAESYLDAIDLGIECSRGGVVMDELVSIAIESLGSGSLQKIVDKLDAATCRESAVKLQTFDSKSQTWSQTVQQEHDWSRRAFPGIRNELTRIIARKSLEKNFQKSEQVFKKQEQKNLQLIVDLAARAYELDKGRKPAGLADLVPDYLNAVPQDPFTGTNMIYLPR